MRRYVPLLAVGLVLICVPCRASGKKGMCTNYGNLCGDVAHKLHATWIYNWSGTTELHIPSDVEYVPMVWGGHDNHSAAQTKVAPGARELLGFNEPDLSGQGNLTVDEAVAQWPILERYGLRLGSPAA